MVLFVFMRNHCGMFLFCFCFFARIFFTRKVLLHGMLQTLGKVGVTKCGQSWRARGVPPKWCAGASALQGHHWDVMKHGCRRSG